MGTFHTYQPLNVHNFQNVHDRDLWFEKLGLEGPNIQFGREPNFFKLA